MILDSGGAEIDRIEGYRSPEEFTKELERIRQGNDTLPTLRKKAADAPDDVKAGLALARKLTIADPREAVSLSESCSRR